MTKGEISLLYVEVEKLLSEICSFLKEEIAGGNISDSGRSVANKLIEKSKKQLQTIAIITSTDSADCTSESYVDMQNCKVNLEEEESQEVYSDISLFEAPSTPVNEDYISCPYANLPAIESMTGKNGHLYKKERFFFIGQQKKVFAAVQQSWLLIYMNENSLKPCQTFDLTRYEAKAASTLVKDVKKREETFTLTSFVDSKTYHFTAITTKDMLQWVGAINKQSEKQAKRDLPPVPATMPNILDRSPSPATESMNEYEPLTEYQLKQKKIEENTEIDENKKIMEKPIIPLPPRNTPQKTSQRPIPRVPSEEYLSSNYDSVDPEPLNSNSFSEDDSDTFYDNPSEAKLQNIVTVKFNGNNGNKQEYMECEDELYDYLEPHASNTLNSKPENTQTFVEKTKDSEPVKAKPILKPKILSLRRRKKNNT